MSTAPIFVDADYIVYKACCAAEEEVDYGEDLIVVTSNFSAALKIAEIELERIRFASKMPAELWLFFSDHQNFRKTIDPDYKGQRNRKKPCGYKRVINALKDMYKTTIISHLEADDAIGIYATSPEYKYKCTIATPDKDMRQIPGYGLDLNTYDYYYVTENQGRHWFYIQALAGDQTDGYSGAPGFGAKTAKAYFDKHGYSWETLVKAYESKGLTEEDALRNATLARILQHEDYDFHTGQLRLWSPSSSVPTDGGAAVQSEDDGVYSAGV